MKVWLLHMESYGEVDAYVEETIVDQIPFVKTELGYLTDCGDEYADELLGFYKDVDRARINGTGEAGIEERFRLELVEVKS